jgi:alkylation response protein AidB-like acyl-CoA dehydrogenase
MFSEDESAVRDMVRTWANTELKPHVREMDREGAMRPDIIKSLFDNGLMGMEIPEKYGGSEMNFTSAIIAVEEVREGVVWVTLTH